MRLKHAADVNVDADVDVDVYALRIYICVHVSSNLTRSSLLNSRVNNSTKRFCTFAFQIAIICAHK